MAFSSRESPSFVTGVSIVMVCRTCLSCTPHEQNGKAAPGFPAPLTHFFQHAFPLSKGVRKVKDNRHGCAPSASRCTAPKHFVDTSGTTAPCAPHCGRLHPTDAGARPDSLADRGRFKAAARHKSGVASVCAPYSGILYPIAPFSRHVPAVTIFGTPSPATRHPFVSPP